jgi:DNA polymerase II small subunit/DNA polymerase delta subunit B
MMKDLTSGRATLQNISLLYSYSSINLKAAEKQGQVKKNTGKFNSKVMSKLLRKRKKKGISQLYDKFRDKITKLAQIIMMAHYTTSANIASHMLKLVTC